MKPVIKQNIPLAPFTSFKLGGPAENFCEVASSSELLAVLQKNAYCPVWLLGYGSNTLISDEGLPGLTICMRGGAISVNGDKITIDAGVWWDDVVKTSITQQLWGIELLSEVPGSVGAALFINITAYGQSIGPLVNWVDVWDPSKSSLVRINRDELAWSYKKSIFQDKKHADSIIVRAELQLSNSPTTEVNYQKAIDIAQELSLDTTTLQGRRKAIIEARRIAGSLWNPKDKTTSRTAGSFFKNPIVTQEQAETITTFDETGKTKEEVKKMNLVHGGSSQRVSAAHVLLAAGFHRGQQWGNIRLHEQNLLKIEALDGASSQELYDVIKEIQATCRTKLGVELEPEARIIGKF